MTDVLKAAWAVLNRPHIWLVLALIAGSAAKVVPHDLQPYAQAAQDAFTGIGALTMQWLKDMTS